MRTKRLLIIAFSALSMSHLNGQQSTSNTDDNAATVNSALAELEAGLYTSIAAKRLARLGDAASSTIIRTHTLKEISGKPLAIAQLISESFNSPILIGREADKTPKFSILLLTYLRATTKAPTELNAIDLANQVIARELLAQAKEAKANP